ncbi:MAG: hypothetical protein OXH15_13900 [Gammaproteobacteria bacterium]|nr:hypothetical protein [Gammaproteobacteria bacterium]
MTPEETQAWTNFAAAALPAALDAFVRENIDGAAKMAVKTAAAMADDMLIEWRSRKRESWVAEQTSLAPNALFARLRDRIVEDVAEYTAATGVQFKVDGRQKDAIVVDDEDDRRGIAVRLDPEGIVVRRYLNRRLTGGGFRVETAYKNGADAIKSRKQTGETVEVEDAAALSRLALESLLFG